MAAALLRDSRHAGCEKKATVMLGVERIGRSLPMPLCRALSLSHPGSLHLGHAHAVPGSEEKDAIIQPDVLNELARSTWYLWHGNVAEARSSSDTLELVLDDEEAPTAQRRSHRTAL